ncbi:RraA family protein [Humitalea sp. 24SJ18S-53]|uniref:RraA family protein n=1 Tax=Humitalea sp. 24SJ18S-53 TaxID=3422307 RepID=UPI003D6730E3
MRDDTGGLLAFLRRYDTPTVWNALATLRGRGIEGFTRGPSIVTDPQAPPMVGYARTAKMVSSDELPMTAAEREAIRYAYYRYVGAGGIVVMQDCGSQPGLGSIWGEVHAAIHRGLGVLGVITNGAVRDLDALGDFPIIAGSICLGNGVTQIIEIDTPVEVMGLRVNPGELIHADRHGAMTIPETYLPALPGAIEALLDKERVLIAQTKQPGFDAEALIAIWQEAGAHR